VLPLPAIRAQGVGRELARSYYAEEAEKILKPARLRLQKAGLSPTVRSVIGRPAIEISKTADKDNVDLLVLGSHGHSALAGMFLGSVTNEVLVLTKRATLIVRGSAKRFRDSLRIGIAVDGSPSGLAAVRYVLRHPELFGASLNISLIHVVPEYDLKGMPSRSGYLIPEISPKEVKALQDHAFEGAVGPVRKLLKGNVAIKLNEVRLVGSAGPELSAYAKKKLDLLALGSHGYNAFKATVLGSVAARVTANSTVPVLLIRRMAR
jgi:nucleotide-binding universal stress UspA family protein